MILLLPVGEDDVHAVKADRVVAVERSRTQLRLRVDFGTHERTYELEGDEYSIGLAWSDVLAHFDQPHYQVDLTWLKKSPGGESDELANDQCPAGRRFARKVAGGVQEPV